MLRLLGILLLSTVLLPQPAQALFFDVPEQHPYADAITWMTQQGIVSGYSDRSFLPDQYITRAEMTKMLVKTLYPDVHIEGCRHDTVELPFSDVGEDAWYYTVLCTAWIDGIVQGYPDGTFHPEDGVLFVEAAAMLSAAFSSDPLPAPRLDEAWFTPSVEYLASVDAIAPSISSLGKPLTRSEVSEMLYRLAAHPLHTSAPIHSSLFSKSADALLYPVDWKEYRNDTYLFSVSYPNVWPAPIPFPRGHFDGSSPYFRAEWTVYFGPDPEGCYGLNTCVERDIRIDGFLPEDADAIVDALIEDQEFISLEEETTVNTLPAIVTLEERSTCIDRRAFIFGSQYIYVITARCAGEQQKLYEFFGEFVRDFRERK